MPGTAVLALNIDRVNHITSTRTPNIHLYYNSEVCMCMCVFVHVLFENG